MRTPTAYRRTGFVAGGVVALTLLAGCATPIYLDPSWGPGTNRTLPECPAAYTDEFVSRGVWALASATDTVDTVVKRGPSPSCVLQSVTSDPGSSGLTESALLATYLDLSPKEIDQAVSAISSFASREGMKKLSARNEGTVTTVIFDDSKSGTTAGTQLIVEYVPSLDEASADLMLLTGASSYISVSVLSYSK